MHNYTQHESLQPFKLSFESNQFKEVIVITLTLRHHNKYYFNKEKDEKQDRFERETKINIKIMNKTQRII